MRHNWLHYTTILILLAGLVSSGFAYPPASPQARQISAVIVPSGSPIEIAVALWSGFPNIGDLFTASQMAIDDYGAIKGFSFQRHEFDPGCNVPGTASAVAGTIISNTQIVGVIGPLCSSAAANMGTDFETAGVVMISPTATGVGIEANGPGVFNRVVAPDPSEDWISRQSALLSAKDWDAAYESAHGHTPSTFAKFTYDAMTLLLTRIDQVSALDASNNLVIDRAALAAAVRTTSGFPAVTGVIDLDPHGNRLRFDREPVWSDQFGAGTLAGRWYWVDEDPSHWSLSANPGSMRITTQATIQNRLLQGVPMADYTVRTKMTFTPQTDFNFAGIMIYGDANNLLAFGRAFCSVSPPGCTGGDGIYFDYLEDAAFANHAVDIAMGDSVYLQVVRAGDVYTGSVSTDGTTWTEIGAHTIGFVPQGVGLFAQNNSPGPAAEINADFDYFTLQTISNAIYLPMINR